MVTVNQIIRSYAAAAKSADRDQKRRATEAARAYKDQIQQVELADASRAVNNYNEYINALTTLHLTGPQRIDWGKMNIEPEPLKPVKCNEAQVIAENALRSFKPSFIDKIFGQVQRKKSKLQENISAAIKADADSNYTIRSAYSTRHVEWKDIKLLSLGIIQRNPQFYEPALSFFDSFSDLNSFGSEIKFTFSENHADIEFHVNGEDAVPTEQMSLTKTGKLSRKDMPKGKYNELYQDYVCSAVLRIAIETMAILPIDMVTVHSLSQILNTKTGYLENQPIVSAVVPRETLSQLNLHAIDPSDSMQNFKHAMKFSKTKGFSAVDRVSI
jgi:hypothetical protein